jgi:predicted nucleic acid-binding protein
MRVYFDTSYLVRLYLPDQGFEAVRHLAAQHAVVSARLGRTETYAAFHRVLREGRLNTTSFQHSLAQFEHDCGLGAFAWLPLSESVLQRAERTLGEAAPSVYLRAGDAIHLASAAEHGFSGIHSHDRHLLASAPLFGLKAVNIIPLP